MNLNKCEEYFGFAVYAPKENKFSKIFVCLNLPDENERCLGVQVNNDNIPVSSLLYVLYLNSLDNSVVDKIEVYDR